MYKLGKLPAKHDLRTLCFENYYTFPDPPAERLWSSKVSDYGMIRNDEIGDCAIAGPGHLIQTWTANADKEIILSDDEIVETYSII